MLRFCALGDHESISMQQAIVQLSFMHALASEFAGLFTIVQL